MTPTPAQIEAATQAIFENDTHQRRTQLDGHIHYQQLAKAALTAVAEVGEPVGQYSGIVAQAIRDNAIDATIERCAQVAETFPNRTSSADRFAIAAAIRALKDKKTGADPNLIYPGKDADFVFPEE